MIEARTAWTPPERAAFGAPRASSSAVVRSPQFFTLATIEPAFVDGGKASVWTLRGQNFVVQVVVAHAAAELVRTEAQDEHMVVMGTSGSRVRVSAGDETATLSGRSVLIVPPGDSRVAMQAGTLLVRMFTARSAADLLTIASNASSYSQLDPKVAEFEPWTPPPDGFRLHHYRADDVPRDASRLGRIFQSSMGMVNLFYPEDGPRDDTALTPHHHADFEQFTVQLYGDYVQHMRTPWGPRLADWRPDEHRLLEGAAVTIIPAGCIHTTQAVHDGPHQLLDLFAPPRTDWADRPGWVVNAADYPTTPPPDAGDPREGG
jgi:hypothetical protein